MVVCDTHALVFDALAPQQLSPKAARAIQRAEADGVLACADISLWEVSMLIQKGRLTVDAAAEDFLEMLLASRAVRVLPITPKIAALAASPGFTHGDPADRLIAATALANKAPLITKDARLRDVPNLKTLW